MITITLFENKKSQLTGFTVCGHAGYGEHGTDIVCAAVTTAAMTAVNGLTDVVGLAPELTVEEGNLSCCLPAVLSDEKRHDADVLLSSMVLTMENLAEQYGDYVSLKKK
ncbi:MAG: ribosomal-processing cysteine protease Prp [Ruminococcaceae bacterium]|nr:ribosomal-processing cysteine protease Prp [Oscillospiraceae bacterium]